MPPETNGSSTLLPRIGRLLHAKQFLVFYAIGLFVLSYVPPLVTGWLREERPLGDLLDDQDPVFADLWSTRGVAVAAVVVTYLGLTAWFRAGYLRSLTGGLNWRPATGRQFRRLLGLTIIYELLLWGFSFAAGSLGLDDPDLDTSTRTAVLAQLALVVSLGASLVLLYVDFAIVVSDTSLWTSFRRSLATVRANLLISALIALLPVVVGLMTSSLTSGSGLSGPRLIPTIVAEVVVWGTVVFVAEVVLLCVYVDTLERPGIRGKDDDAG
jgi:hypothetical protein